MKEDQTVTVTAECVKTALNRYIYRMNIQDLSKRTNIMLDKELERLFEKERVGKTVITYNELRE